MSHIRVKTKYNSEGPYGSIEEHTLYALHNLSLDYVTFYDEQGDWIMTIPDTIDNNKLDAINRLYSPSKKDTNGRELDEGIEYMDLEDIKKCKL